MEEQQPSTISIQVPPNATAGDVLTFVVNGQELELTLPEGSAPNDVLGIQVGAGRDDGDTNQQEEASVVTIPLSANGMSLLLNNTVPGAESVQQESQVDDDCDGTFAMLWPAGLELVRYLDEGHLQKVLEESSVLCPRRVLELGSGLGLVGLCFASTCCSNSNSSTIVLTDCPSAIPLLQQNVAQNRHMIPSNITVTAQVIQWEEEPNTLMEPFDLILGSDLLYNISTVQHLVATIQRHSHPTRGRIVFAVRWRKPDLERRFFELLEQQFEWTLLWGSCDLGWKEYGSPSSERSNRYFRQTMVSVQGKPISLAQITESSVEVMTEEESRAWERAQIQIYMGVRKKQEVKTPA